MPPRRVSRNRQPEEPQFALYRHTRSLHCFVLFTNVVAHPRIILSSGWPRLKRSEITGTLCSNKVALSGCSGIDYKPTWNSIWDLCALLILPHFHNGRTSNTEVHAFFRHMTARNAGKTMKVIPRHQSKVSVIASGRSHRPGSTMSIHFITT